MTIPSETLSGNRLSTALRGERERPVPRHGAMLDFSIAADKYPKYPSGRFCGSLIAACFLVLSVFAGNVQGQYENPAGQRGFGNAPASGSGYGSPASGGMMIPSASLPDQTPRPQTDQQSQGNASDEAETSDEDAPAGFAGLSTLYQRIAKGGFLMIPLAICSLVVIALACERLIALRRRRVIPRPFVRRFTECVEDGQLSYEEAAAICDEFDCPVAEVFHAAVKRWGRPVLEVEQAVMDAGDRVADGLRRFLRVFHAISNVAPLLGLLGTVLGMIEAFDMMATQEAAGRPELLASGISVALMTTAGGLTVAIPAYLAYIYFTSRADRYLGEIDRLCQHVIDSISAEGLQQASNGGRSSRKTKRAA